MAYSHIHYRGVYDKADFLARLTEIRKRTRVIFYQSGDVGDLYFNSEFVEELCELLKRFALEIGAIDSVIPDSVYKVLKSKVSVGEVPVDLRAGQIAPGVLTGDPNVDRFIGAFMPGYPSLLPPAPIYEIDDLLGSPYQQTQWVHCSFPAELLPSIPGKPSRRTKRKLYNIVRQRKANRRAAHKKIRDRKARLAAIVATSTSAAA